MRRVFRLFIFTRLIISILQISFLQKSTFNNILFFSIMFCPLLLCCTKRNAPIHDPSGAEVIYVDVDDVKYATDLSPYLESDVDIIALETNDDCLISEVLKIEFHKDNIFISDRITQKLYRFHSSGEFMNSVGEIGAGPEEYVELGDFNVIDELVYLHDYSTDKIVVYTLDGKFVKIVDHSPIYFREFVNIGDKLFFVTNYMYSSLGCYNIYEMDLSTKEINGYSSYDEIFEKEQRKWSLSRYISKGKDSALAIFANSNLIFNLSENGVYPEYAVHFSARVLPEEEKMKDGTHAMSTALSKGYILGMSNIYNSENYLFFSFSDGSKGRELLYDKANNVAFLSEWLFVNDLGNLYGTDCFTSNNEFGIIQPAYMYRGLWKSNYSQSEIKDEKNRIKMQEVYENIVEDDNPVIFRFRFKDDKITPKG